MNWTLPLIFTFKSKHKKLNSSSNAQRVQNGTVD